MLLPTFDSLLGADIDLLLLDLVMIAISGCVHKGTNGSRLRIKETAERTGMTAMESNAVIAIIPGSGPWLHCERAA